MSHSPVATVVIIRHGSRLDSFDPNWACTSPTPYDPPLASPLGLDEARACGDTLAARLNLHQNNRVYIHSSPFLRCAQTAGIVADSLKNACSSSNVKIRLDAVFGEWMNEDYFANMNPPPSDGHSSIAGNSTLWLATNRKSGVSIDTLWSLSKLGKSGLYGESWGSMHKRFIKGMENLLQYYERTNNNGAKGTPIIIVVTHGAGCNSLLGYLSNQPLLTKVGLAQFVVAQRNADGGWVLSPSGEGSLSTSTSATSLGSSLDTTPISSMGSWFQHGQYHKRGSDESGDTRSMSVENEDGGGALSFGMGYNREECFQGDYSHSRNEQDSGGLAFGKSSTALQRERGLSHKLEWDNSDGDSPSRTPTDSFGRNHSIGYGISSKAGSIGAIGSTGTVTPRGDQNTDVPMTLNFGFVNKKTESSEQLPVWSFAGDKRDDHSEPQTTQAATQDTQDAQDVQTQNASDVLPYLVG